MTKMNRRDAMRFAGVGLGSLFACGAAQSASASPLPQTNPALVEGTEAWKYAIIDPEKVARDAYYGYHVGHCMHTTFTSIVTNVASALEKTDPLVSAAMLNFPFHMLHYGASGANGWGTLCGSLNGAMAAVNLFCANEKTLKAICDELGNYYERTMFPNFMPDDADPLPQSISGSVLCHVSVGKWAQVSKYRTDSPERTDRCSRLSADMAKKTAELLNLNIKALNVEEIAPIVALKRPEPAATCIKCHNKGGTTSNTIGKMTCRECHPEKTPDHSLKD